ncbi:MAG: hypothetical protein OEN52_01715 [Gammaproteobacteria bacterium]|nr:hypothetical protein [Gammaproteobacteria bacterium]MDH3559655.1 hypothetical protein [Gammaproteobacteria bacterium]
MKRILVLPFLGVVLLVGVFVLMLTANLYTFHRLIDESPIAELSFAATGAQQYQATIAYGDFCKPEHYRLDGDQWRLDALFLKWHPWANLLGLDSMYRIERLGGRYRDTAEENTKPRHAHELHPQQGTDLASMIARYTGRLSPVDTLYGSSVYDDMDEAFVYRVYRGQSGLLVRKARRVAPVDDGDVITIDINKTCSHKPGLLRRAASLTERLVHTGGH